MQQLSQNVCKGVTLFPDVPDVPDVPGTWTTCGTCCTRKLNFWHACITTFPKIYPSGRPTLFNTEKNLIQGTYNTFQIPLVPEIPGTSSTCGTCCTCKLNFWHPCISTFPKIYNTYGLQWKFNLSHVQHFSGTFGTWNTWYLKYLWYLLYLQTSFLTSLYHQLSKNI